MNTCFTSTLHLHFFQSATGKFHHPFGLTDRENAAHPNRMGRVRGLFSGLGTSELFVALAPRLTVSPSRFSARWAGPGANNARAVGKRLSWAGRPKVQGVLSTPHVYCVDRLDSFQLQVL